MYALDYNSKVDNYILLDNSFELCIEITVKKGNCTGTFVIRRLMYLFNSKFKTHPCIDIFTKHSN